MTKNTKLALGIAGGAALLLVGAFLWQRSKRTGLAAQMSPYPYAAPTAATAGVVYPPPSAQPSIPASPAGQTPNQLQQGAAAVGAIATSIGATVGLFNDLFN